MSTMTDLRMDAYYYSFTPTGVDEIDRILSAVARAGKAYHHTQDWANDDNGDDLPVHWIQRAANEAAQKYGWQPIETAPKDGTPVWAYQPGGTYSNGITYPGGAGVAYWYDGDSLNDAAWSGPFHPRGFPTHWMPLHMHPPKEAE